MSYITGYYNISGISNIIWITPPTILNQPQNGMILNGSSYKFSVNAIGTKPIQYLWFKNNLPLNSQTTNTLSISNATIDDQGYYYCSIINPTINDVRGNIKTDVVYLSVLSNLAITKQPESINANPNGDAKFEISYIGVEPINIEWFFNDQSLNLFGAVLDLGRVSYNNNGLYYAKLSNSFQTLCTNVVSLSVNKPIKVFKLSNSVRILAGNILNIECKVYGTGPINFYWTKNGTILQNTVATLNNGLNYDCSYSKYPTNYSDFGTYQCVLSNVVGQIVTQNVTVKPLT